MDSLYELGHIGGEVYIYRIYVKEKEPTVFKFLEGNVEKKEKKKDDG